VTTKISRTSEKATVAPALGLPRAYLLSAVCCLLSAVCCLLSAVCYLLSAVCCLLSTVYLKFHTPKARLCTNFKSFAARSTFTEHSLFRAGESWAHATTNRVMLYWDRHKQRHAKVCYPLPVVSCLLLPVCCLLCAVCCPLSAVRDRRKQGHAEVDTPTSFNRSIDAFSYFEQLFKSPTRPPADVLYNVTTEGPTSTPTPTHSIHPPHPLICHHFIRRSNTPILSQAFGMRRT
jgi:hypothetical protein